MGLLKSLMVPVNTGFDWDKDPNEQPEYVNPVTLNNREIQYANAALHVMQRLIGVNKQIGKCKLDLKVAQDALEDFEQQLLLDHPPASAATKSTRLLMAYIRMMAEESGQGEKYDELRKAVRKQERSMILLQVDVDNCEAAFRSIKLSGEHIQTHLSFVKNERNEAKRYT